VSLAVGPRNVHATAIVIGTTGLLFLGPSGSGKSSTALHCLARARARGLFAALVSDDQVLLEDTNGAIVARAPATIAGLLEVRGTGIFPASTIEAGVMHHAVRLIRAPITERIAPEAESVEVLPGLMMPVTRLALLEGGDSFSTLAAIRPEILGN
jgi:serine kinase of HPr protein (carbohydrate metabolism regulator)